MRKKNIQYIFVFFIACIVSLPAAFSEDIKVPCIKADGGIGLRGLDKFDCKLVKGIVNDPKIKEDHEKKIIDKLASQLAIQADQTIEEMALLDQYYSDNGGSLLLSKDVEDNCQLQVMSKPVCEAGYNQKTYDERMKILKGKFPTQKGDSLMELWSDKFAAVRDPSLKGGQCPLTPSSGIFLLNAQLTEYDVKGFIDNLKGDRSTKYTADADNLAGDSFYYKYPQLKLLKTSESMGKDGALFKKQFEDFAKSYPGTGSYKEYLSKFFLNQDNKKPLASAVAHQCEQITKNMKKFLCSDLKSLAVPEDEAAILFFTKEEEAIDLQISKGFSCDQEPREDSKDVDSILEPESAGDWSKKFTTNTRLEASKIAVSRTMNQFCSMYNCNDKLSKRLKSCEKGGPVTSEDLEETFCKEGNLECSWNIQKAIALLQPIERAKKHKQAADRVLAGNATEAEIKEAQKTAPVRSAFSENFVRNDKSSVGSSSFVADKKLGIIAEERKYETILDKKSDTTGTQALAGKTEMPKPERAQAPQQTVQDAPAQPRYDSFIASNVNQENENVRRALINSHIKTSAKDAPAVARKFDTSADSERADEMKKLRAELADAISGVKGSEEERLAAVTDNNRSLASPKGAVSDSSKGLSQAERDRLDQYRENLNSWEGRLRNWQGELTDREMRAFGSSGAPSAASAEREERARASQDGFGSSSGDSAGGLKLTKSGASGGGSAVAPKGEAGAERTPGTEGAEGDVGVVNSESLATLRKDTLKNLGIVVDDTFIIRVRHKDKIYAVPVKTFSYKGKEMYVPILNDNNRELSKIVFNSPLFSDYRQYQAERESRK